MLMNQSEYLAIANDIKERIREAQYRAAVSVNREMILLYYDIGIAINAHKAWGNRFIENLSRDIHDAYPDIKGYSVRNLSYMAKIADAYPDREFVQQAVAQIPWGQNVVILDKIPEPEQRRWYIQECRRNGWSRNVLVHQIETDLYGRQVLAEKVTNFPEKLPSPQSEMAVQMMKDPYVFDFIPFRADIVERDIQHGLTNISKIMQKIMKTPGGKRITAAVFGVSEV